MVKSPRNLRSLVAVGLAIGLVAAACSSNSIPGGNGGLPAGNGGNGGNGGNALASGLASNLDKLDSYQFSWQLTSNSSTASSADTGSFGTSGIVVNKPTPAYKINDSLEAVIELAPQPRFSSLLNKITGRAYVFQQPCEATLRFQTDTHCAWLSDWRIKMAASRSSVRLLPAGGQIEPQDCDT